MEVKTTFLNGHLEETIYMVQLEGLWSKAKSRKSENCKGPFMDSSKLLDLGTSGSMKP